eukprot:TRINITY_DN21803_c0_g1_i1.p1 TRINITY_DN21803_c0_g1~~TRINITY_DN21803_c0_g1_i1.p1  ORF type:complete len:801 (+),score=308.78 TRINITY_DN21803_c0_g1_i1:79-2481(+)
MWRLSGRRAAAVVAGGAPVRPQSNGAPVGLLSRAPCTARQARGCKIAKATILGWTTDGCVDSRLEAQDIEDRKIESHVLQSIEEMHSAPKKIPAPVRSLPCLRNTCVRRLLSELREGRRIPLMDAMQILSAAAMLFRDEPSVRYTYGRVVVVGDLHGSLGDLLHILDTHGLPGDGAHYIFNGDLVDRGNNSCEILLLACILKLSTPDAVHINRGNHEFAGMNVHYGFYVECVAKYNLQFFDYACNVFSYLPLAAVVNDVAFVCHGGLFDGSIEELKDVPRGPNAELTDRQRTIREDLLWSDPTERADMRQSSTRGSGMEFGKNFSIPWLDRHGLKYLVRSHQCKSRSGLASNHGGRVLTIFSASNYYWTLWPGMHTSAHPNDGSVLVFEEPVEGQEYAGDPLHYSWEPMLLPVDNPMKSPILALTNQPFQLCVPDGRLYNRFSAHRTVNLLVVDTMFQRMSELMTRIREYDPSESGVLSTNVFMREVRAVVKYLPVSETRLDLKHFLLPGGRVKYREYLNEQITMYKSKQISWQGEVMMAYVDHMQTQGNDVSKDIPRETLRSELRSIFAVELLSEDQLTVFLERFYDSRKIDTCKSLARIDWAVDRRKERVESMRSRLRDHQVDPDTITKALQRHCVAEGLMKHDGIVHALSDLGVPVTECFVHDLIEEIGRRRESLDEPGAVGWMDIDAVVNLLTQEESRVSDVTKALGLSQAFLTVLYRHQHELATVNTNGQKGIATPTIKRALMGLNKANGYPLSHMQIRAVLGALDEKETGFVDVGCFTKLMGQDEGVELEAGLA